MEENNLIINNKFFSFEGIIGRRDFFLNTIYIQMIGQFFIYLLQSGFKELSLHLMI